MFRLDEMPTPECATEIIFEGSRCVVIAPEDYAAMYARIAAAEAELAAERARADAAEMRAESLQARIDALMLEYCPDEMTPEQVDEWERHQRRACR